MDGSPIADLWASGIGTAVLVVGLLAVLPIGALAIALVRARRRALDAALLLAEASAHGERLAAELERARRLRHELLANVSHDLRTPLAALQGHLELMLLRHGHFDAAEERGHLQAAVRQGDRLGRLVGDLFDLTRLEAGELAPQREEFSVAELVQDVVHQYGDDARRRGVELEGVGIGPGAGGAFEPLQVHADMALVARVLDNLVDNALRHTPRGGRVTLQVRGGIERVALLVSDTGSGIAPEDLRGVFERYDRLARVGAAQADGHSGLGLAIARRIVRLHGSELELASRPGEGTRVGFDLPRAAANRLAA